LVTCFKAWLHKHHGASAVTIKPYARDVVLVVTALGMDPTGSEPADVRSYFLERASRCGIRTLERLTTDLRAFLRYITVERRWQAGLDAVVPAHAHWQLADMPRYLSADQVSGLIAACDGETIARWRDRAIVQLLARFGLRAGGVA
jgi:site-specific recombinase XerD